MCSKFACGRTSIVYRFVLIVCLVSLVAVARPTAQSTGAIAGVVKDATGAVLPGVTIEATSPVLLEKVRSVTSDSNGQYRITELPPGQYLVVFTLPGFATLRREGVELTSAFTASVNVELPLKDVTETVTVSGAAPVVDVQNVLQQRNISREVIDTIPTAKTFSTLAILIPGVTVTGVLGAGRSNDVGGSAAGTNPILTAHGGRSQDQRVLLDGLPTNLVIHGGGQTQLQLPAGSTEEVSVQIGAHAAEADTGGVRVNIVPKTGGNTFVGSIYTRYTNSRLQSANIDDDLRAQGLPASGGIKYMSNVNPSVGGPILRNKIWFYGGYEDNRVIRTSTTFYDTDPNDWVYTPDFGRGVVPVRETGWSLDGRVTWQVSAKNKVSVAVLSSERCTCEKGLAGTTVFEASSFNKYPARMASGTWVSPVTNRVLFEAGGSAALSYSYDEPQSVSVGPAATELNGNIRFRAAQGSPGLEAHRSYRMANYNMRGSASYVTGTHAVRIGTRLMLGKLKRRQEPLGDYIVTLLRGVPNRVDYLATPVGYGVHVSTFELYAQDQWTVRRLTVNTGLRFDWLRNGYPDVNIAATRLIPERNFPGADVLDWKDISPRLGVAYNLFGDGKTAIKASLGRYLVGEDINVPDAISPANSAGGRLQRAWTDFNGNFVPDGDPLNPLPNGELVGPSTNLRFGQSIPTIRVDPDWQTGWHVRAYNWETSFSVQQQLRPGVSATAAYFRRTYGNFSGQASNVVDNTLVSPEDYDHFCITAPRDPRLPGGGGYEICDLWDLKPTKVGLGDNVQTTASKYGKQSEHWQGVDLTLDARVGNGVLLQGGFSAGKTVLDDCDVRPKLDNPSHRFCHREQPLLTQLKFVASYMLPLEVQVAGTWQDVSGLQGTSFAGTTFGLEANYVATNSQIAPSLGRSLSAGPNSTVTVNLIPPGTLQPPRMRQLDLRVARSFVLGGVKLRGMVDLYNALNANPPVLINSSYGTTGATWLQPQSILQGRLVSFGAQLDF